MVLLVCFLVAKLSDTNLLVLKRRNSHKACFKNFITYLLLMLSYTAFSLILVKQRSLYLLSAHTCTGLGFAHLFLVRVLEHIKWQCVFK